MSTWPPQSIAARELVTAPRNRLFAIASAARAQPEFFASESLCFSSRNEASCNLGPCDAFAVASLCLAASYTGKHHWASARASLYQHGSLTRRFAVPIFIATKHIFPFVRKKTPQGKLPLSLLESRASTSHFTTTRRPQLARYCPQHQLTYPVAQSHLHEICRRRRWLHFPTSTFSHPPRSLRVTCAKVHLTVAKAKHNIHPSRSRARKIPHRSSLPWHHFLFPIFMSIDPISHLTQSFSQSKCPRQQLPSVVPRLRRRAAPRRVSLSHFFPCAAATNIDADPSRPQRPQAWSLCLHVLRQRAA